MYGVFYLQHDIYKWSLISYNLTNCIKRLNELSAEKKVILIGPFSKGFYTQEEIDNMEKVNDLVYS